MVDSTQTNIWTVISKYGSNEVVTLLVVFAICLMLFVVITKPSIKIGSNSISFGQRRRGKTATHTTCPFSIDFFHVITKTTEIVTKICYLENITIVERQMDYVEQKVLAVKSMLMQNYAQLLQEKTKAANVTAHDDYLCYNRLVESMLREDIKDFIKRSLINDDVLNFSETEFRVYVREKSEFLFQVGSQFMDVWYISNKMQISREELRVSVVKLKDRFYEIVTDVFSRSISIMNELLLEKDALQEEADSFYEKVIGCGSTKIQIDDDKKGD